MDRRAEKSVWVVLGASHGGAGKWHEHLMNHQHFICSPTVRPDAAFCDLLIFL